MHDFLRLPFIFCPSKKFTLNSCLIKTKSSRFLFSLDKNGFWSLLVITDTRRIMVLLVVVFLTPEPIICKAFCGGERESFQEDNGTVGSCISYTRTYHLQGFLWRGKGIISTLNFLFLLFFFCFSFCSSLFICLCCNFRGYI